MLAAKLFNCDLVPEITEEIRSCPLRKYGFAAKMDAILHCAEHDLLRLQRFVRSQFMCLPRAKWTPCIRDFISTTVQPTLEVSTTCWSTPVVKEAAIIAKCMASNTLSTIEELNLKLGCAVACGALEILEVVLPFFVCVWLVSFCI